MADNEVLKEFLTKLRFRKYEIDDILEAVDNEVDIKIFLEKIKYLIEELKLGARVTRILIFENPIFLTATLNEMKNNVETLKKYIKPAEISDALEVTPEFLTMPEDYLAQNIELLRAASREDDFAKYILINRGEALTTNPEFFAKRIKLFQDNGFKEIIDDVFMCDNELFCVDEEELDFVKLKRKYISL